MPEEKQDFTAYVVSENGKTESYNFGSTANISVFLTEREVGSIATYRVKNEALAGLYICWVDPEAKEKGREYNAVGSRLSGAPVYGKLLMWRSYDDKALPIKENDIKFLERIAALYRAQLVKINRSKRRQERSLK